MNKTKRISLTKGYYTIVDDDDYEFLNQFKWRFSDGYAVKSLSRINGRQRNQYMHRLILKTPEGFITDHINGNSLDNRKENLRICTQGENSRNQRPQTGKTSIYKGVCWIKSMKKWRSQIRLNKSPITLGFFDSEVEAALNYNIAAQKYHGEFARLNEIE